MKKALALIMAAMLLLSCCACSGGETQQPSATQQPTAAPDTTPEANEPEAAPSAEPTAAPSAEPEAAPREETPEAGASDDGFIREEDVTDGGSPITYVYKESTGELVSIEICSEDGVLEFVSRYENGMPCMDIYYNPDGSVSEELYYDEFGNITGSTFYVYDENGNLITTETTDAGEGGFGDTGIFEYPDGSYEVQEYGPDGKLEFSTLYNANDQRMMDTVYSDGIMVMQNFYEEDIWVARDEYIVDGCDVIGVRHYSVVDGSAVLEYEDIFEIIQPEPDPDPAPVPDSGSGSGSSQSASLPAIRDWTYATMTPAEAEAVHAACGFEVSVSEDTDFNLYNVYGDLNGSRRAIVSLDPDGLYLPWIRLVHALDDSSAPMDIGLRGIKTHDSMLSVMKALGIPNAESTASLIADIYAADDIDRWYEETDGGALSSYYSGDCIVYYMAADTGTGRAIGEVCVCLGYDDDYSTIILYFKDGVLIEAELGGM